MFFELTSHLRIPTRIPWRWLFLIGILIPWIHWCISFRNILKVDLVWKGWEPQSSLITNHESQVSLQLWKHVLLLRELFLHVPGQNNGETMSPRGTHKWVRLLSECQKTNDQWLTIMEVVWRGGSVFKNCLNHSEMSELLNFYVHTSHSPVHTLPQNIQPIITSPKETRFTHLLSTCDWTGLCSFRVSSLNASACTSCRNGWSISMHPSRYISAMAPRTKPSYQVETLSESWCSMKQ